MSTNPHSPVAAQQDGGTPQTEALFSAMLSTLAAYDKRHVYFSDVANVLYGAKCDFQNIERARDAALADFQRIDAEFSMEKADHVRTRAQLDQRIDDFLAERQCCNGFECGCGGVTRLQWLIAEEAGTQLTQAREQIAALDAVHVVALDALEAAENAINRVCPDKGSRLGMACDKVENAIAHLKTSARSSPRADTENRGGATMNERLEIASRILAGFAANPSVFAPNDRSGWGLVNCKEDHLAGYALHIADELITFDKAFPAAPTGTAQAKKGGA